MFGIALCVTNNMLNISVKDKYGNFTEEETSSSESEDEDAEVGHCCLSIKLYHLLSIDFCCLPFYNIFINTFISI